MLLSVMYLEEGDGMPFLTIVLLPPINNIEGYYY